MTGARLASVLLMLVLLCGTWAGAACAECASCGSGCPMDAPSPPAGTEVGAPSCCSPAVAEPPADPPCRLAPAPAAVVLHAVPATDTTAVPRSAAAPPVVPCRTLDRCTLFSSLLI